LGSITLCRGASFDKIIPRIIQKLKDTKYDAILLDPLYKLYGKTDENSAGDVAALMNELERLAVKSKAAVVFGAHYSKGNQAKGIRKWCLRPRPGFHIELHQARGSWRLCGGG